MSDVAVLTGGTSGLGRYVALGLVRAGRRLVLVARNAEKAAATRDWLLADQPAAMVEIELADLSLMRATRQAAEAIAARHSAIGILVLNAGMFQPRRTVTAEGHEMVLAVNHLSPFVMISALQAPLRAGQARVVVVGSSASDRARIDPDNLELKRGWGMLRAYGRSKLALLATSLIWAERLAPTVSVNVVHPGAVATEIVRASGPVGWSWALIRRFLLTPEQGAATPLRAALDPTLAGVTGRYMTPKGFRAPNRLAMTRGREVWKETEAVLF